MTIDPPRPECGHEHVESQGLSPDDGGQVHELASCVDCGSRLRRPSPLHDWTPLSDPPPLTSGER